jgi:hypothetical protein
MHRLDRPDRIEPGLARRGDPTGGVEAREPCLRGAVVDAASPVALDVAVPPDRTGACALPSDVSPQEKHVHDLADRVHGEILLSHSQAPAEDGGARLAVNLSGGANLVLGNARLTHDATQVWSTCRFMRLWPVPQAPAASDTAAASGAKPTELASGATPTARRRENWKPTDPALLKLSRER